MSDDRADKYVYDCMPHCGMEDNLGNRRLIRLLVKTVERDTRHKAVELAQKLANDIHNLRHDQP